MISMSGRLWQGWPAGELLPTSPPPHSWLYPLHLSTFPRLPLLHQALHPSNSCENPQENSERGMGDGAFPLRPVTSAACHIPASPASSGNLTPAAENPSSPLKQHPTHFFPGLREMKKGINFLLSLTFFLPNLSSFGIRASLTLLLPPQTVL